MAEIIEKPILGFNEYLATSDGRILSIKSGKRVELNQRWHGTHTKYLQVSIYHYQDDVTRKHPVHQLICRAFKGDRPTPNHVARHLDDNKQNNAESNLAWGTRKDNHDDMVRNNPHAAATRIVSLSQARRRHDIALVLAAYDRWQSGEHLATLCIELGITSNSVYYHAVRQRIANPHIEKHSIYVRQSHA